MTLALLPTRSCRSCGSPHPDTTYWTLDGAMEQTVEGWRRRECQDDFHFPEVSGSDEEDAT